MTDGGKIKIIIGAGLDRSVEASFGSIAKMAERTGRQVNKAMGGSDSSGASAASKRAKSEEKASRDVEASLRRETNAAKRAADAKERLNAREVRSRERAAAQVEREQDKALRRETAALDREERKRDAIRSRAQNKRETQDRQFAERVSHRSVRFLFPNPIGAFGMAGRISRDVLRGAGVDFSMAGMSQRAVQAQLLSTQISTQGYMRNEPGANSHRVAASTLETEARTVASNQGFTPEQMLSAQMKFIDLTGDLASARQALPGIAKLSGATSTDPEKMAEAWANVSRHMGDIPNKAAKVEGLMRLIAGQGRVGSIEIKDEARDLGKIAAMADKYTGDRATTIGKLSTLAQLGKAEGGAASSQQAATSVMRFTDIFQTPQRVKALMKMGLKENDIFQMTGSKGHQVRTAIQDPFSIIKKVLEKSGGDLLAFSNVFKSVMAQRATNALVAAYNSGGGRNMKAVDAKLNQFGSEAALTSGDVDYAQSQRMKTTAIQAVVFQNKLDLIGRNVESQLLPALQQLSPEILKAASVFGDMLSFAAKHPGEAIVVAITGAVLRAGLEATFRAGVERMVLSAKPAMAGLGGSLAALSAAAGLAAAAMMAMDADIERRTAAQRAGALTNAQAGVLEGEAAQAARHGAYTEAGKAGLMSTDAKLEERIKAAEAQAGTDKIFKPPTSTVGIALDHLMNPEKVAARLDAQHMNELKAELAANKRILELIRTGTLTVHVENMPGVAGGSAPTPPAAGRTPPHPGH